MSSKNSSRDSFVLEPGLPVSQKKRGGSSEDVETKPTPRELEEGGQGTLALDQSDSMKSK